VHLRTEGITLKTLLRDFRYFPGLSVHWVMFGSNGLLKRPEGGGMLQHYTTCGVDPFDAVKTIANTYYVQHVLRQPHNFRYRCAAPRPAPSKSKFDAGSPVSPDRTPLTICMALSYLSEDLKRPTFGPGPLAVVHVLCFGLGNAQASAVCSNNKLLCTAFRA
jgi:hypothetical protein